MKQPSFIQSLYYQQGVARAVVWLLRHTLLVIERLYERLLLHFLIVGLFSMFEYLKSYW